MKYSITRTLSRLFLIYSHLHIVAAKSNITVARGHLKKSKANSVRRGEAVGF
jgi:predicted DNA-binding protein with PD1-like motif